MGKFSHYVPHYPNMEVRAQFPSLPCSWKHAGDSGSTNERSLHTWDFNLEWINRQNQLGVGHVWCQNSPAFWSGKGLKVAKSSGSNGCSKSEPLAAVQMQQWVVGGATLTEAIFSSDKFYSAVWALFLEFSLKLISPALPKILWTTQDPFNKFIFCLNSQRGSCFLKLSSHQYKHHQAERESNLRSRSFFSSRPAFFLWDHTIYI